MRLAELMVCSLLLSVTSCSKRPATAVMLQVVASPQLRQVLDDAVGRREAVAIALDISGDTRTAPMQNGSILIDALLTPTNGDATRTYTILATVNIGGRAVAQARVRSGYVSERVLLLRLEVFFGCTLSPANAANTCNSEQTCTDDNGGCQSSSRAPASLPNFATETMDAGLADSMRNDLGAMDSDTTDSDTTDSGTADVGGSDAVESDAASEVAVSCGANMHACGLACVRDDSPNSCGSACSPCTTTDPNAVPICRGPPYQCGVECIAPMVSCGGTCVSTQSNPNHCSRCDNVCNRGNLTLCENGACRAPIGCTSGAGCTTVGFFCNAVQQCEAGCDAEADCPEAGRRCDIDMHQCVPGCNEQSDCTGGRLCMGTVCQCPTEQVLCTANGIGTCTTEGVDACGPGCMICGDVAHGTRTCNAGGCGFTCTPPYVRSGNQCVCPTAEAGDCLWAHPPAVLTGDANATDFGASVGVTQERNVFVGDPNVIAGSGRRGKVYRFAWSAGWQAGFVPNTPADTDDFGRHISCGGSFVAVKDPVAGRVFLLDGSSWVESTLPGSASVAHAGLSVNASGHTIVCADQNRSVGWHTGLPHDMPMIHPAVGSSCLHAASSAPGYFAVAGAPSAFAYSFVAGNWVSTALEQPSPQGGFFGWSLAASDNTYFVGALQWMTTGAVYAFARNGGSPQVLRPAASVQQFGRVLAANSENNVLVVSAANKVFVYERTLAWGLVATLDRSRFAGTTTGFGESLAVSADGTLIAIGDSGANVRGRVYVFLRNG